MEAHRRDLDVEVVEQGRELEPVGGESAFERYARGELATVMGRGERSAASEPHELEYAKVLGRLAVWVYRCRLAEWALRLVEGAGEPQPTLADAEHEAGQILAECCGPDAGRAAAAPLVVDAAGAS